MNPSLILAAAAICGVLWLILPGRRRGRAPASHNHDHHGGGLLLLTAAVIAVVAGAANRQKIIQFVQAKPPPPQVVKVTNTVTRYVPVPTQAGHPLLSGWVLVAAICAVLLAVVCVVYLVGRYMIGGRG